MKKYIVENGQEYEVKCYYNKGGMNYFTSKVEARGFYLSVCPVKVTRSDSSIYMSVEYLAFSGVKTLLMEVKRYSKSAEQEAIQMAEGKEREIIDYVVEKNRSKTIMKST